MKKVARMGLLLLILLTGCSDKEIREHTEVLIKEYLTLRFEAVNSVNQIDSDTSDLIEHTELFRYMLSEDRFTQFVRKAESKIPLRTEDFVVVQGGTLTIESITLNKIEPESYHYEVVVIVDNLTEKLRTKYTGLLKIADNSIYFDSTNKEKGVTEKIE